MGQHANSSSQNGELTANHIFRLGYSEMGVKEKICVVCDESFRTEDGQLKAHQVRIKRAGGEIVLERDDYKFRLSPNHVHFHRRPIWRTQI